MSLPGRSRIRPLARRTSQNTHIAQTPANQGDCPLGHTASRPTRQVLSCRTTDDAVIVGTAKRHRVSNDHNHPTHSPRQGVPIATKQTTAEKTSSATVCYMPTSPTIRSGALLIRLTVATHGPILWLPPGTRRHAMAAAIPNRTAWCRSSTHPLVHRKYTSTYPREPLMPGTDRTSKRSFRSRGGREPACPAARPMATPTLAGRECSW
jgi:hypothetical protein